MKEKLPRGAKAWAMIYRLRIAKAGAGAGSYSPVDRLRPRVSGLLLTSFLLLARFCVLPCFFSTAWILPNNSRRFVLIAPVLSRTAGQRERCSAVNQTCQNGRKIDFRGHLYILPGAQEAPSMTGIRYYGSPKSSQVSIYTSCRAPMTRPVMLRFMHIHAVRGLWRLLC